MQTQFERFFFAKGKLSQLVSQTQRCQLNQQRTAIEPCAKVPAGDDGEYLATFCGLTIMAMVEEILEPKGIKCQRYRNCAPQGLVRRIGIPVQLRAICPPVSMQNDNVKR